MGDASYVVPHFLGGEISQFAQGRFDKPDYRTSLNVCFNAFPVEIGPWTRRPGTRFGATTRRGVAGRVIKFDFEQAAPYSLEFTDGFLRFRTGPSLVVTLDTKTVSAISTATPAVVETSAAHGWATDDTVIFQTAGAEAAILQNREFEITVVDPTHFSIADALTGAAIDGATITAFTSGATVSRVHELETIYGTGSWADVRAVQAETTSILLAATKAPQALTVVTPPTSGVNPAQFAIEPALFLDGPYLDPVAGSTITPSATSGLVNVTLSFQDYSATLAYSKGDYVLSSGIGYKSLQDANIAHTPASSPTFWTVVGVGDPVNSGLGFVATDIGRLIRLFNSTAPGAYNAGTTYNKGDLVSASSVNYRSLVSGNIGHTPSSSPLFWEIYSPGWTWGRITAMSTTGLISPGSAIANVGNATLGGGLSSAYDGNVYKTFVNSAYFQQTVGDGVNANYVISSFIGKQYGSPVAVSTVIITPPSDNGFMYYGNTGAGGPASAFTVNLRGSNSIPSVGSGTLLATSLVAYADRYKTIPLTSNDAVTTFEYLWVEISIGVTVPPGHNVTLLIGFSQIQFFNNSGAPGTIAEVQIIGPPLPNTNTLTSWRIGVYSDTSGFPTCGTYFEGRIWLGGAVPNRFDASVSNGIDGGTLNFAPTDQTGAVAASNAISYVLNSDSVNPIFWFQPDLQGIIIGTQAGEWLVQAPTAGSIAPNNIAARRVTKNGCANVEPRRTENTNVFVQRYGQKLMEYFADVYSGKFSAPNLADKAQHISRVGIAELAYQQAVTPIIWGRGADNSLFSITYKRDTLTTAQGPTYAAWARHEHGAGRTVESLCAGPSVGGNLDTLTMVTNDPDTGVRHVELLTDTPDESSALADAWFLDGAVAPSSTLSDLTAIDGAPYGGLYLYGLWHLNGKTVQVFAGGLDCGDRGPGTTGFTDFVVSNGATFIPYGDGVSGGSGVGLFTPEFVASFASGIPVVVGLTYDSDGQLVRPVAQADTGARNGPGFAKTRRTQRYGIQVNSAKQLSIGTSFDKMRPVQFKKADGQTAIGTLETFSGVHQDTLLDDYSFDGMICWRVSRPFPANMIAVGGNIQTQDQ